MHQLCYCPPLPQTCRHRFSNASTMRSVTIGKTAWLAIRWSGLANVKARSIVRSVGPS